LLLRRITRVVFLLVCMGTCVCAPIIGLSGGGAFSAMAQVNTASLTGLVADQTNAALVHAHVTATNNATGLVRETDTDAAGYYSFPDLPIGEYRVVVTMDNFQTVEARVTLGTAERVRRDLLMKVGTAQANVEVTDVVNNLSPDDASIGTVVDNNTIQGTPLYLRNWDDLLRLIAGVQISRYTQQSGATSAGRVGDFNVHGVHSLQNNFLLDGIDNNTISENVQELSTESAHPSVDTIQEFAVVTNPYSAEYGRSPGAAVSISTKGGSNQFHGLAYEYLRNAAFDANDFISNEHNLSKPENNQNQFGGNFGGPILKNKLFGFFNYEGTRIKQGVSRVSTVPLPNERIGDFSPETAASLGLPAYPTIYDPTTGLPFPDNKIPAGRIDTAVSGLMNLFPLPNASGDLNNYVRNALAQDNDDSYDGRIDFTLNSKNNFFGRYSYSNRFRFIPGYLGGIADGTSTSAWGRQFLKSYSFVLGYTHTFTPTLVNDFHFGWIRNYSYAEQDPFGKNAADEFVPGIPNNPAIAGGVPLTTFSNFGFIGSPDFLPKRQIPMQYQYSDTISWTHGAHSFKFGGTLWAPMRNIFQDEPGTRGDLGFTGVFTSCAGAGGAACPKSSGLSYADGLLGLTQSTQLTNVFFVDQRLWMLAGFAEDDWKVTRKLTLNLGLRYDFATPALEANNQMANFDPTGAGSLVFAQGGSLENRALVQVNKKNFGPRVGFAYSIDPKTVIRGGYGIYYSLFERIGSEDQLALNPPFLINKTLASNKMPVLTPEVGFPANFLDPSTVDFGNLTSYHIRSMNSNDPTPMVQQWSIGVQRQIGNAWLAELNYVGTRSTHLDVLSDFNQPTIIGNTSTGIAPYANFGYVEYTNSIGVGKYNGLEATLSRRFTNGLSVRLAYTYSRSLDNTPEELESNSGAPPNGRDYAAWYGPSDFDIPHRVALSYVYELPFGTGRRFVNSGLLSKIIGGFQTSGVYTYYSGHPFTVNEGGTLAAALDAFGQATAVPNVVGNPVIVGNPNCWFYVSANSACTKLDPSGANAYQVTATGVVGDSGRNTLRGPHTNVFDFSLVRDFPIKESLKLQFRWEVFNLFNAVLFGQPNNNVTSGAAGQITTLSGDPRVMQFALRLSF
jgi:Carboxypeptidase regulatory-like domain/TonB-dependent Receptor Plug Domain/TonB dependent receptor